MNNKNPKVGRSLEEINEKKILKFGNLCENQKLRGVIGGGNEVKINCERCDSQKSATGKNFEGSLPDGGKVYMKKTQVKKHDIGYYIVAGIQFYCPDCDGRHNYGESK